MTKRRLTRTELEDRVSELEDINSTLQEKIDAIAELAADEDEEEDSADEEFDDETE